MDDARAAPAKHVAVTVDREEARHGCLGDSINVVTLKMAVELVGNDPSALGHATADELAVVVGNVDASLAVVEPAANHVASRGRIGVVARLLLLGVDEPVDCGSVRRAKDGVTHPVTLQPVAKARSDVPPRTELTVVVGRPLPIAKDEVLANDVTLTGSTKGIAVVLHAEEARASTLVLGVDVVALVATVVDSGDDPAVLVEVRSDELALVVGNVDQSVTAIPLAANDATVRTGIGVVFGTVLRGDQHVLCQGAIFPHPVALKRAGAGINHPVALLGVSLSDDCLSGILDLGIDRSERLHSLRLLRSGLGARDLFGELALYCGLLFGGSLSKLGILGCDLLFFGDSSIISCHLGLAGRVVRLISHLIGLTSLGQTLFGRIGVDGLDDCPSIACGRSQNGLLRKSRDRRRREDDAYETRDNHATNRTP